MAGINKNNIQLLISDLAGRFVKPKLFVLGESNPLETGLEKESELLGLDRVTGDNASTQFGTPVFDRLVFGVGNIGSDLQSEGDDNDENNRPKSTYVPNGATEKDGKITFPNPVSYGSIDIDTALITVTQTKNIVKTALSGRDGTIKQMIAQGDFDVDIRFVIASEVFSNNYPLEEVKALKQILDSTDSIKVASQFLTALDIENLVVENYTLPQTQGFENIQQVRLRCSSDKPIEIRQLEEDV